MRSAPAIPTHWSDRRSPYGGKLWLLVTPSLLAILTGCPPTEQALPERAGPQQPPTLIDGRSGSLRAILLRIPRMTTQSRDYPTPDEAQLTLARRAFEQLAKGHYERGALLLSHLGFETTRVEDDGPSYYLVQEPTIRGWGYYVVNPNTETPLIVEAPHAENDAHTDEQAIDVLLKLNARALLVSTAYRCATRVRSRCSGRTLACEYRKQRWAPYRISDVAHTERAIFHVAHAALFEQWNDSLVVQLHGFDRRPGRRMHFIVSDGTRRRRRRDSLSNRLVRLLRRHVRPRRSVLSCNNPERLPGSAPPLCGTQNVQGRHANGSANPCRRSPRRSRNRFVHIEQSLDARTPGGKIDPQTLLFALIDLLPPHAVGSKAIADIQSSRPSQVNTR